MIDEKKLDEAAKEEFQRWFAENYPGPDTLIYDPYWHAPRIFARAKAAIEANAPKPEINGNLCSPCGRWVNDPTHACAPKPEMGEDEDAAFKAWMSTTNPRCGCTDVFVQELTGNSTCTSCDWRGPSSSLVPLVTEELPFSEENPRALYVAAMAKWGFNLQTLQAIEELAELIVELRKYHRRRSSNEAVLAEIADVMIMMDQLVLMFKGEFTIEAIKKEKLKKLASYLNKNQERKFSNVQQTV